MRRVSVAILVVVSLTIAVPVYGYRTPFHSLRRSVYQQDTCPGNLLLNPSFEEGGRKTENIGTSLSSMVANGWFPWFIRGDQRFNREPEFKIEDATRDPLRWRVHTGYFSQKFFTTWATHTAGIYQRVAVPRGSTVEFSIWVQIYTGERDGWDGEKHTSDPDAPGNYRAYVGIDPYGNTPPAVGAPPPDTVIWSDPIMIYDTWTEMRIQAVAQADFVTVYTRGQPEFSVKHNDSFWDTACLQIMKPAGPVIPPGADAVVNTAVLNFRAGPGTEYDVIGTLKRGEPLTVNARTYDGSWLAVTNAGGTEGWVFTDLLMLGIALGEVPMASTIPPTPTAIPSITPTLTKTPKPTATDTPSPSPTPSSTDTPRPTLTPTPPLPTVTATAPPTATVVIPPTPPPSSSRPLTNLQCTVGTLIIGLVAGLGVALLRRPRV